MVLLAWFVALVLGIVGLVLFYKASEAGKSNETGGFFGWGLAALALFGLAAFFGFIGPGMFLGATPFGPERTETISIKSRMGDAGVVADYSMLTVLDVNNDAFTCGDDQMIGPTYGEREVYMTLEAGKTYEVVVRGNRVNAMLYKAYPRIVKVVREVK